MSDERHPALQQHRRLITIAVMLAVVALVVVLRPVHSQIEVWTASAARVVDTHPVAGIVVFVLLSVISAMLAFFSTAAVVPVAVTAWGKFVAVTLLWLGWWLGGALSYCIGRFLGRSVVSHFLDEEHLAHYEKQFSSLAGFAQVLLLQLALPSEIPGYVLGVLRYPPRTYLLALAIAELPFALGAVFLGESFLRGDLPLLLALGVGGLLFSWAAATMLRRRVMT